MFNEKIGNFKYFTKEDITYLFHVYVDDKSKWDAFYKDMKEIYFLTKSYANKLDNYERLYTDDRR